jgi:uncharacterized membrane protein
LKFNLKHIFLAGLAVVVPIGLTLYILVFIIGMMDGLLTIMPVKLHPDTILGFHIPGLGIMVTLVLILICGLMAQSILGKKIVRFSEGMLDRIPVVRSIHSAIKKIVDSMFMYRSRSFRKVVLVEFPRKGVYTVAFVTGTPNEEIQIKTGRKCLNVYVPTTPNPTSGYFIVFPEEDLIQLDMTVEEAFTLVISGGIVNPPGRLGEEVISRPREIKPENENRRL